MHRIVLIGATLALSLNASLAAAQCETELQAVLAERPQFAELPPDDELIARRNVRGLATAARQLAADGHEAACLEALDALAVALTGYHMHLIDRPVGEVQGGEDLRATGAALDVRDPRLMPVTEQRLAFATRDLRGNDVFSLSGDVVGEFEGFLTGRGERPGYVLIGTGGFWNVFENRVAVPASLVRWDPEKRLFYVPFGEEQLKNAPEYDREGGWDAALNDQYYARLVE